MKRNKVFDFMTTYSVRHFNLKKQSKARLHIFNLVLTLLLVTLSFQSDALQAKSPAVEAKVMKHIVGKWKTPQGDIIGFYKCGKQLCGRILKTTSGLKRDKQNSNPKLRNRPINGLTIMRSVKKSSIFKWHGYVYNVKDGQTYKAHYNSPQSTQPSSPAAGQWGFAKALSGKKSAPTSPEDSTF